ncbi:zinc-binding dehydrogenase [Alkalihalobacillus sp. AL-G]|uniref:zinc-binding dehydrogenase n=1 Tax=Alkalihalobacillus sp. AL-G TaxID=2926399 RepID=UPI00272D06B4|nr:zinc-binding dehydrogenase [Alkalihalobacillus sp. AL-G]WLD93078.1 zinc-binding dehydrogenase [Alkalihalobacillus sp. AL-G]
MRSVILAEHGSVDQLKVSFTGNNHPLKEDEIRINVKYCALNHLDLWLRKGGTGDKLTLPRVPGSDIAGVIVKKGSAVGYLDIGEAVLLYPGVGCGHCTACLSGQESQCHEFKVVGYNIDGGYSEFITVKAKQVVQIPNDNLEKWAAVPISYITAWNALVTKAKLTSNDTLAIWGATGGLGFAATSIAHGIGARVIGIVGSEEKADFLKRYGFASEIVVRSDSLVKEIRNMTSNKGVDVVLDHVGKQTWSKSLKMLKTGGRLAFCGVTTGTKAETDLRYIFGKQLTITGSWLGNQSDFHEAVGFLRNRPHLLPFIYQVFNLDEVGEAHTLMERGDHIGKILLKV